MDSLNKRSRNRCYLQLQNKTFLKKFQNFVIDLKDFITKSHSLTCGAPTRVSEIYTSLCCLSNQVCASAWLVQPAGAQLNGPMEQTTFREPLQWDVVNNSSLTELHFVSAVFTSSNYRLEIISFNFSALMRPLAWTNTSLDREWMMLVYVTLQVNVCYF